MNNMRRGFTIIELIFVLVIIGILAAIALPKLTGIKDQAHAAKAGEFVGQLNSIIMPNLYSKAVIAGANEKGNNHAIQNLSDSEVATTNLSDLIDVPEGFEVPTNAQIKSRLADSNATGGAIFMSNTTNKINIYCRDGNETVLPRCWYSLKSTAASGSFKDNKASF